MTPRAATPLEPCPFCGGEASLGSGMTGDRDYAYVNCGECLASTNLLTADQILPTDEEAAAAWNTRAPSSPLVGELREALVRYGQHELPCRLAEKAAFDKNKRHTCNCGLESALARAGKERG